MKPWILAGTQPKDYTTDIDAFITYEGKRVAFLRCQVDEPKSDGFGTLMQSFKADKYRNKRMRFSAAVKSEGVTDWAGLWMRVDGPKNPNHPEADAAIEFDNMQDRPITGNTDWLSYRVVLDVPPKAVSVHFGVLLGGKGQVLLSDVKFKESPNEESTCNKKLPDDPSNLDFSTR